MRLVAPTDRSILFLVQDLIARDVPVEVPAGHELLNFSATGDWKGRLAALDRHVAAASPLHPQGARRFMAFVSLDVARHIRRHCQELATGLWLPEEQLRYHAIAGAVPEEVLLNRSYILLPLGALAARTGQLRSLFGDRLFIRPDSPMKPFAGTPVATADLASEISALRQIHALQDDLLVMVDRAQDIDDREFRFWLADGEIVTQASYSLMALPPTEPPGAIHELAARVAGITCDWTGPVVADFALDSAGLPRLVEMNAVSTSGFYPGMDAAALFAMIDRQLL